MVNSTLSPLDVLAYDFDHALFGFRPSAFYAHNLLSIGLAAWTVYLVTPMDRSRRDRGSRGLAVSDWVPVAISSEQLMGRNYIEGWRPSCFAVYLFVRAAREQRPGLATWAGMAYAVSATAKEIFLPLGLVPFCCRWGRCGCARLGWPFLLVMLLHIPWRSYMLGNAFRWYQPAGTGSACRRYQIIGQQLLGIPGWMLPPWGVVAAGAALGLGAWLIRTASACRCCSLRPQLGLLLLPAGALARHQAECAPLFPDPVDGIRHRGAALGLARLAGHDKPWWRALALGLTVVLAASAWSVTSQPWTRGACWRANRRHRAKHLLPPVQRQWFTSRRFPQAGPPQA